MVSVRCAVENDAESIYSVHVSSIRISCASHYSAEEIRVWSGRQNVDQYRHFIRLGEICVAVKNDVVVGFGHVSETGEIRALYVAPSETGKGIGKMLLKELERRTKERVTPYQLTVQSTINSVKFYESQGFQLEKESWHTVGNDLSLKCFQLTKAI